MTIPWSSTLRHILVDVLALAGFIGGFSPLVAQNRQWKQGSWRVIGGVPADSPDLLNPIYLAVADSLLVVYDLGDYSVKAFRTNGTLKWHFGRLGEGPGEFQSVADMQLGDSGRIWLSDGSNLRLTILGLDGKLIRMVRFPSAVWSVIPTRGDSFLAKLPLRTQFFDLYSPKGALALHLGIPKTLLHLDYNQAVQNAVANRSGVAVAALRWGSEFFVIDLLNRAVRAYQGFDSLPPAKAVTERIMIEGQVGEGHRIDPRAESVTESVAIDREHLYLLTRGSSDLTRRTVDQHRLTDGVYEGSYFLPSRAAQIVRIPRGFALLITDPTPRIDVLEWVPLKP